MKKTSILLALIGFSLGACERHDWESTKKLYEHAPAEEKKEGETEEGH